MDKGSTNSSRLALWGESVMNKLPSKSRKQRKRLTSKKRRVLLRREDID